MSFFNKYSLSIQLTAVFSLVFMFVIAILGIYDYNREIRNIKNAKLNNMLAISKSISAAVTKDIYTNNYIALENKILGLNEIDEICAIRIFDNNSVMLSEITRNKTNNLEPTYKYGISKNALTKKFAGYNTDDSMVVRMPLHFSGKNIAWIELKSDSNVIEKIKDNVYLDLILLCGTILIITFLSIFTFLRIRLRSLQELIKFSAGLPLAHGDSIKITNAPREFQMLMRSLNWASKEIEKQHKELTSKNNSLEKQVKTRTKDLETAKNIAETASKAKTEFLSRMSHELRTPMNAVLGFSQLMQMDKSIDDKHLYHVDEIVTAGTHLLKLINELLDLSTIESGAIEMDFDDIVISGVVKQMLSLISPIAGQHNVSIECANDESTDVYVRADAEHLGEVLLNLLSNAVKYNQTDGKVWLSCDKDADYFYLHVHDSGVGLNAEQIDVIFEPFNRAGAETGSIPGTGIGLSISKKLMMLMNGDITVESQPCIGTRFTIKIPLSKKK